MDKKILSAAIAGALAGSMAFAANGDVTLYGQVDLSVDSMDADGGNDDINMNSNTSAIGVKGSEDLGNGLKAIFQLEYQIDPTGSQAGSATNASGSTGVTGITSGRDQWLGLQGSFGKVRFGTMSTTYKASGAMIDPMYRTSFQGRDWGLQSTLHGGGGEDGQGRTTNAIAYDSPDFNGFSVAATYSFDEDCGIAATATASGATGTCPNKDDDSYSLGARYKNGPALVFADYITSDHGGNDDAWKVGGSYAFGDFKVFGQYEADGGLISSTPGVVAAGAADATNEGADVWHLGGSFTMGNAMLYAAYGQGDDDDAAGNSEYDVWTIGGQYSLSKRTMAYAGFQQISCDGNTGVRCGGALGTARTALGETGGEVDHFGIGMRHKF